MMIFTVLIGVYLIAGSASKDLSQSIVVEGDDSVAVQGEGILFGHCTFDIIS